LRVNLVRELTDSKRPRPLSLRNAFKVAAQRLGISPSTVERDWYNAKKTS